MKGETPKRLPRHDILFEPIEIRSKVFRNRFYSTPHASFVPGRRMSDIAFRRMKAEGGWAVVCGGVISIRSDSWGGLVPRIWDEDERVMLGRVSAEVKGEGALAGIEFGHGGSRSEGGKFTPSLGASQLADPGRGHLVPKQMDLDDIRRLQDDWVAAASSAVELGYDIVYAYGGHGTLPAQFLSPFFNKRTDGYGGSLENRARFFLELIERIRAAVGDNALVAARVAAEALSPYGIDFDDTLRFIQLADEMVDIWDVNVGYEWSPDSAPSRLQPEGFQVEWSGRVRQATSKPIVGVGRLTDPDKMVEILRSGVWDFIGGARPGIADPFLPRKIRDGRYDDIRECTGTNFCIAVETTGAGLSCVQNATIGEEYRRGWHPERFKQPRRHDVRVLVLGAGPAGMECARVLGERGFTGVHLVERKDDIGGHLQWLRRLPGLGDWGRVIDYRKTQLEKLSNVQVISGTKLDTQDVLEYGANLVVVATGSRWIGIDDEWHLVDLDRLRSPTLEVQVPESIMELGVEPSGNIVVWDGEGWATGVGLAEKLARDGHSVTMVSRFERIAPELDHTFEGVETRRRLRDLGVSMCAGRVPIRAEKGGVLFTDDVMGETMIEADTLVLVAQRTSEERIFGELIEQTRLLRASGIEDVVRIGDCVSPRHFGLAVADGHRMGREIDGENPQQPLEPRRERDGDALSAEFALWR